MSFYVDTTENLPLFDDTPRGTCAHFRKGSTTRSINARETKNMQGQVRDGLPVRFSRNAHLTALGGGFQWATLIDPAAIGIAVDAGRGEVADPFKVGRMARYIFAQSVENRIAIRTGRGGNKQVGCAMQGLAQVRIRPDHRGHARRLKRCGFVGGARRARDREPLLKQERRQRTRRKAVPERKQMFCHIALVRQALRGCKCASLSFL